jgi:signal transduction histidine kinase
MNLAHELRSPLASLRALIDLLAEDYGVMNERDSRLLLQALRRAIVRFQRMVENLIDMGTVQAGRFHVRPIPNMLEKIVQEAISQVELQLQASAHSLQVSLEDDSVIVLADWPRLVQVMVNLLTNASKYSPKGTSILLSSRQVENMVRVDITDHGPGIAPEDQLHLFERFYRVKRAEDDGIGIGLGLALAKAIIEGHGGEIGLESQLGQGTTFWFTLPRVE